MTVRELIDRLVGLDMSDAEVRLRVFLPKENALADWSIDDIPDPKRSVNNVFIEARADRFELVDLMGDDPDA